MTNKRLENGVSGVVGTASGIGTTLGTVAVGAAEGTVGATVVTSGLATAGSIIGGGMLTGVAVIAVAGTIVGIGTFFGVKRLGKKCGWW
jgi:hypothetical protein